MMVSEPFTYILVNRGYRTDKSSVVLLVGARKGIPSVKFCTKIPKSTWSNPDFSWKKWPLKRCICWCVRACINYVLATLVSNADGIFVSSILLLFSSVKCVC